MIFYGDGAGNSRGVCVNSLVPWRNSLTKVHDIILSIFVHDVTWCMTSLILFSCMMSSVYQFKWGGEPRNLDGPKVILIFLPWGTVGNAGGTRSIRPLDYPSLPAPRMYRASEESMKFRLTKTVGTEFLADQKSWRGIFFCRFWENFQ